MKEIKSKLGIARDEQSNTRPDLDPCRFPELLVSVKTLGYIGHIKDIRSCIANSKSLEVSSGMTIAKRYWKLSTTPSNFRITWKHEERRCEGRVMFSISTAVKSILVQTVSKSGKHGQIETQGTISRRGLHEAKTSTSSFGTSSPSILSF